MKKYEFTVTLQGEGDTQEEAWDDAVNAFYLDSGVPNDDVIILEDDDAYS